MAVLLQATNARAGHIQALVQAAGTRACGVQAAQISIDKIYWYPSRLARIESSRSFRCALWFVPQRGDRNKNVRCATTIGCQQLTSPSMEEGCRCAKKNVSLPDDLYWSRLRSLYMYENI